MRGGCGERRIHTSHIYTYTHTYTNIYTHTYIRIHIRAHLEMSSLNDAASTNILLMSVTHDTSHSLELAVISVVRAIASRVIAEVGVNGAFQLLSTQDSRWSPHKPLTILMQTCLHT